MNCLTYDTVNVDIGGVSTNLVRFTSGASIDQPTILNLLTNQAGQAINANGVGGVFDPNNFDLVLNPIIYNNPNGTPAAAPFSQSAVAFAAWNNAEVSISSTNANKSLHSNRGYEVGIVYMDEYNRSTTALTSSTNTVSTTCSMSDKVNYIRVEIPPTQLAPNWAQTYKFVIKPDEETYDTIYSTRAFVNPKDSCIYFLVDGENASKVSVGQRLIVKKDASGAVETCEYVSVLDKKAQPENFIHPLNPFSTGAPYSDMAYLDSQQQIEANEIYTAQGQGDNPKYKYVPEGVYIKMKNVPFLINGIFFYNYCCSTCLSSATCGYYSCSYTYNTNFVFRRPFTCIRISRHKWSCRFSYRFV